jgi:hypothetical protein
MEGTMFAYSKIKSNANLLLAMTSLTQDEFENFLVYFKKAFDDYVSEAYINRPDRKRQYGGGKDESTLTDIEDKLLFVLYYVKVYPLQEIIAYEFGMDQSTANQWIHLLSRILQKSLDDGGYLPERNPDEVGKALASEVDKRLVIDGTERRIQRPKDEMEQTEYYSGKKKAHTVKNILIGVIDTHKISYLSQTYEGKRNDKRIADEEAPLLPKGSSLYQDLGFQGYTSEGVTTFQPHKKPKGKELTPEQKDENRLISRVRVVIEHIIAGVKRCRIVKDVFRNTKDLYDDVVMEIACGLHNFRVQCRKPA